MLAAPRGAGNNSPGDTQRVAGEGGGTADSERLRRPHPGLGAWHDAEGRVAIPLFVGGGVDLSAAAVGRLKQAAAACARYREMAAFLALAAGRRFEPACAGS